MDLGIEVILQLFSKEGLQKMFLFAERRGRISSENVQRIYALRENYIHSIDAVIAFLQGKNHTLARLICNEQFLPQADRFAQLDELDWAFGSMGMQDRAKHLATLYLEDLSDFIIACVDAHFGFSRYAERLGRSANSFDELYAELRQAPSYMDGITLDILEKRLAETQPQLVCFSVPFPGNLYSAFRCAQYIKSHYPTLKIAMGGGFPNTELRSLSDTRVFEFFDFICLDDGELPIELLTDNISKTTDKQLFKRTLLLENHQVIYKNDSVRADYKQQEIGTPDYGDLLLTEYISVIEVANPMHSLWSDGRWNKLTMAHGCYWGKCTFCDISLDYIRLYEPISAKILVDRMEQLIAQTGENGFHFVDEAAPPALMREVALEILRRKLSLSWWANIRFEKSFSLDLCRLLVASGCIAVSGGLEVASNRLLALIQKGVTVEQVAQVTRNFTEAGIMVHAYLMYGYPTQTVQETVDSLEMVRQMFELGVLQSGFWHQFALTAHSPVGMAPADYGIFPIEENITFAHNDVAFRDSTGIDHGQFSEGLKKSLFNYMHGIGFDFPLQDWFDFELPETEIVEDFIFQALAVETDQKVRPSAKVIWLGALPVLSYPPVFSKKQPFQFVNMLFHGKLESLEITMEKKKGEWFARLLKKLSPGEGSIMSFASVKAEYEKQFEDFELFWFEEPVVLLRDQGLLVL